MISNAHVQLAIHTNPDAELESLVYEAVAFQFLAAENLHVFETHISQYSTIINPNRLYSAILAGYATNPGAHNNGLLWLLAHYIHLGSTSDDSHHGLAYLEALHIQLAALSTEISVRLRQPSEQPSDPSEPDKQVALLDPYVNQQLLSLVNSEGISKILRELSSESMSGTPSHLRQGTSLLAGYTSTLLLCFPSQADDIRMRLFLASIPTPDGEIPTTKYLWNDMRQSSLFSKMVTESEQPVDILRNYVNGTSNTARGMAEEREWRVALIFLELYVFVLRLSDDDDFFSGITPKLLDDGQPPTRLRACSLSLDDLKPLTTFLKNASFALLYRSREIESGQSEMEKSARSRLGSYMGSGAQQASSVSTPPTTLHTGSTKLGLGSLKELLITAMKMLYERDSRKQFLPHDHWLMTDKLQREDFMAAVIAEDDRQRQEEDSTDSDSDSDEDPDIFPGARVGPRGGLVANSQATAYARMERMRQNQRRALRERRLAETGPKLAILKHMPFTVPFEMRVKIFRQFTSLDRDKRLGNQSNRVFMSQMGPIMTPAKHEAAIRREHLFDDAYASFYKIGDGLKDTISISFIDQWGETEAGIDGGGVTKEFLMSVTTEAFGHIDEKRDISKSAEVRMFYSSDKGLLYPNPEALDQLKEMMRSEGRTELDQEWRWSIGRLLQRFEFLGRIVGKCLYEEILLNISFAGFFLLQWPSTGTGDSSSTYKGSVNDLRDMDEALYKGMVGLKNYAGNVADLGLDFTIEDTISMPGQQVKTVTRNLIPNGDKVPVTNDNRLLYISYVARHRLMQQPAPQTSAFLRGLRQMIRPSWLSMFNQSELQRLVGGDSTEIDLEDLRRNTIYGGLFVVGDDGLDHPVIEYFWNVMAGFTDEQRRDVLKFVTSTPRGPLLGFSQLKPKFSIRDNKDDGLPTASTCVNLLKLPLYKSEAVMREKLLYAVTSGAGFDLS